LETSAQLQARLQKVEKRINQQTAEARLLATKGKALQEEITLAQHDLELYNKVAITLASIGEQRQAAAQKTIEELITRGLKAIFELNLNFSLEQTQRGKTPEVKFYVESRPLKGASVKTSVMDARGGGLAAVVGFLLRLVILLLSKDKEPILILDESFSHVSAEYRKPLAQFIVEIINSTRTQIVLVSHDEIFLDFADKRYKLSQVDGVTEVEEF
jgi:DNA repair exonuclease SbcCD ATPase subunit